MSAPKKLYRDKSQAQLLGVCAGFADYLEADVTLIRLLALAVIIFSGIVPGIIVYFLAAVIMPEKEELNGKKH